MSDFEIVKPAATPKPSSDFEIVNPVEQKLEQFKAAAPATGAKAFGFVGDLLQRPAQANLARHAGRSGWEVFKHGETPVQFQADTELAGRGLGLFRSDNKAWQNYLDTVLAQTVYDPTMAAQVSGLGKVGFAAAERLGLPATMKATNALAALPVRALAKAGKYGAAHKTQEVLTGLGKVPKYLHAQVSVHGLAKQALAGREGQAGWDWLPDYQKITSLYQGSMNSGHVAAETLREHYYGALMPLKDDERFAVLNAVHTGTTDTLKGPLAKAASEIRDVYQTQHYIGGTKAVRLRMASEGYKLPAWADNLDRGIVGTRRTTQYRRNYIPQLHENPINLEDVPPELKEEYKPQHTSYNPLAKKQNPFLLHRAGIENKPMNPKLLKEYIDQANLQFDKFGQELAQGYGARDLRTAGFPNMPAAVRGSGKTGRGSMFSRPLPPNTETMAPLQRLGEEIKGGLRTGSDFGKAGLFVTPFPHMGNITQLLALHAPQAVPKAYALYARLQLMSRAQQYAEMKDAIDAGAVQLGNPERTTQFIEALGKGGKLGKGAQKVYRWSGNQLWTFDDAAKTVYFRELRKQGMIPTAAANEVRSSLVDYTQRSPLSEAISPYAWFPTWRTKMPVATLRGMAKNPGLAPLAGRIAPSLTGGQQNVQVGGKNFDVTNFGPLAETLGLLDIPGGGTARYLRSTASPITKGAAALGQQVLSGAIPALKRSPNWPTYGAEPVSYTAAESTPMVGMALQLAGIDPVALARMPKATLIAKLKAKFPTMAQNTLLGLAEAATRTYARPTP